MVRQSYRIVAEEMYPIAADCTQNDTADHPVFEHGIFLPWIAFCCSGPLYYETEF